MSSPEVTDGHVSITATLYH